MYSCQRHRHRPEVEVDVPPRRAETPAVDEAWKPYCVAPRQVVAGNAVDLLKDGAETFPAMLEAIEQDYSPYRKS